MVDKKKNMLLIYSQAAEKAEKAAEAARTARDTQALTVRFRVHRGSDAVGEWRNQAENGGKMWKKDGKSWKKMGKWTASIQKHDDLIDRNGFVFTFS